MTERKAKSEEELAGHNARWEEERDLVDRIREIRAQLEAALDGGARYFIRKPFAGKALIDAVTSATNEVQDQSI